MKLSEPKFDLYLVSTILFGWITFTWITFLLKATGANGDPQLTLMAMPYLTVSCLGILAAATRQLFFFLATASACFFLSAFFMFGTDYWWVWTQVNAVLSFLCLVFAAYIFVNAKNKSVLSGS